MVITRITPCSILWLPRGPLLYEMALLLAGEMAVPQETPRIWPFGRVFLSVQFSRSVMGDSLQLHGLEHARLPYPSLSPRVFSDSCPFSQSVQPSHPLSSPSPPALKSFPASGSFPMSQFFSSGGQSIGVSASVSVLPMNIQDWFPS